MCYSFRVRPNRLQLAESWNSPTLCQMWDIPILQMWSCPVIIAMICLRDLLLSPYQCSAGFGPWEKAFSSMLARKLPPSFDMLFFGSPFSPLLNHCSTDPTRQWVAPLLTNRFTLLFPSILQCPGIHPMCTMLAVDRTQREHMESHTSLYEISMALRALIST